MGHGGTHLTVLPGAFAHPSAGNCVIILGTDEELFMGPESETVGTGEAAPTDPVVWIQMPGAGEWEQGQ